MKILKNYLLIYNIFLKKTLIKLKKLQFLDLFQRLVIYYEKIQFELMTNENFAKTFKSHYIIWLKLKNLW